MSRSTIPARATPARVATPRRSAPIPSRCFAPVRASRARRFCRGCAAARHSIRASTPVFDGLPVINDAALGDMKDRQLPQAVIDKFADHKERIFSRPEDWQRHLQALGLTDLKVAPDPVLIASEGARSI